MTVFEGVLSTKASSLAIGVDQIVNSVLLFINCIIPSNELVLKRYCYLCSFSLLFKNSRYDYLNKSLYNKSCTKLSPSPAIDYPLFPLLSYLIR